MQTTVVVLIVLAYAARMVPGAPPTIASSSTSLEVLPISSLPTNFTVVALGLPPAGLNNNVTIVPLETPSVVQIQPGDESLVKNLTQSLPDLPASLAGNAYVLSHVVVEIGVLEDVEDVNVTESTREDGAKLKETTSKYVY